MQGEPERHYPTMAISDIKALPIDKITDKNCLLFLWFTSPKMPEALKVCKAWGFQFATIAFVWEKQNAVAGSYTMSSVEQCLVGRKGKIPQPRGKRNIRQFLSVKKGKHSVKPYEVRQRITEMFPYHDKIELFARERFAGWDAWGNEV